MSGSEHPRTDEPLTLVVPGGFKERAHPFILRNGHYYQFAQYCTRGKCKWRCWRYSCRAWLLTQSRIVVDGMETHNHDPETYNMQNAENENRLIMENFQLGLIEYARTRPIIWNQKVACTSKERDDAWIPFAVGFSIPVQLAKDQWVFLSRSYYQELKKVLIHREKSDWYFFDRLNVFLRQLYEQLILHSSPSQGSSSPASLSQNSQNKSPQSAQSPALKKSTASNSTAGNSPLQTITPENTCRTPSFRGNCTNQPTPVGCPDRQKPPPDVPAHRKEQMSTSASMAPMVNRLPDSALRQLMMLPPPVPARPANKPRSRARRADSRSRRESRRRHRDRSSSNVRPKEPTRLTRSSANSKSSTPSSLPRPSVPGASPSQPPPPPLMSLPLKNIADLRLPSSTSVLPVSTAPPTTSVAKSSLGKVTSTPAESTVSQQGTASAAASKPPPMETEPYEFPRPIKVEADDGGFPMPIVSVKPDPDATPEQSFAEKVQEERISSQSKTPTADSLMSKWKAALSSLGQPTTLKSDKSPSVEHSRAELECRKRFLLSCVPDMEKMTNEQRRFFKAHLWSLVATILDEGS